MTPEEIVAFIKEQPTSRGVRLLSTLFEEYFTKQSVIDPVNPTREARQFYDADHNPHPLDKITHQSDDFRGQFKVVGRVKPDQDPAGQGRRYNILTPREGSGKLQIDGRDATRDEIEAAREQLNREAAEQLKQMRDGTYEWLDRDLSPDTTSATFPKGDGSK